MALLLKGPIISNKKVAAALSVSLKDATIIKNESQQLITKQKS